MPSASDGGHVPVLLARIARSARDARRRRLRRRNVRPRRAFARDPRSARSARHGSSRSTAIRLRARPRRRSTIARFVFRHAWFSELPEVLDALASRTSTACCSISASRRRSSTIRRADFRIATTGRSTCGWTRRAAKARRRSSRARPLRELTEVIRDYGEERFAQSVARAIAKAREIEPIVTTRRLANVVAQAIGARTRGDWRQDPAARTFQALRIAVNRGACSKCPSCCRC